MSDCRSYFTPNSSTTSENSRVHIWCCHKPGVMVAGSQPNLDRFCFSLSLEKFPACDSPYMTYWISIYINYLCDKYCSLYCWIILDGIIFSGSFIYSYMSIGLLKQKLAMSAHMNSGFFVDITLLKTSLDVVRSAVGVVTSPGNLIRFPPKVSREQCVSRHNSSIGGCSTCQYFHLGIKKIVLVPGDTLVPTPCAIPHFSFAK